MVLRKNDGMDALVDLLAKDVFAPVNQKRKDYRKE
jgi:hypothetical protein